MICQVKCCGKDPVICACFDVGWYNSKLAKYTRAIWIVQKIKPSTRCGSKTITFELFCLRKVSNGNFSQFALESQNNKPNVLTQRKLETNIEYILLVPVREDLVWKNGKKADNVRFGRPLPPPKLCLKKARESRQMRFRDRTVYVWGLGYCWDP